MCLKKFIKNLFIDTYQPIEKPKKTIKDLGLLDSVWIREEDILFEGWVFDITRRCIIVVYGHDLRDYRFRIEKPLTRTELEQDGKVLYCNEPDEAYIKLSKE